MSASLAFGTIALACADDAQAEAPLPLSRFSRLPVTVAASHPAELRRLARLLDTAFRAIVARYFDDPRIRALYRLPPALERVLSLARAAPYRVGCTRPDFVYDGDGHPRICEVGARYPLNGWMVSAFAARAFAADGARHGLHPSPETTDFLPALLHGLAPGDTVAVIHDREPGTEIFGLRAPLAARGVDFVDAPPLRLGVVAGRPAIDGVPLRRVFLELDRSELPGIREDALAALIAAGDCVNDVRTVVLVHDKRVLAVLHDPAIMRDCLPADDYAALRPYLIPTWAPTCEADAEALLARPENLIAKRNSGGRGVDACVREACDEATWRDFVRSQWPDYVFQPYLEQRAFTAPDTGEAVHLVGMQLCRDGESHGPGVFRSSTERVINLHQQRGRLHPALVRA